MERVGSSRGAHTPFEAKLREVETELARLRGARENMAAVGIAARRHAEDIADDLTTDSSDDGIATVTCDGNGQVHRVVLDSARYNRVDENRLCAAVLQARQRARQRARRSAVPADAAGSARRS